MSAGEFHFEPVQPGEGIGDRLRAQAEELPLDDDAAKARADKLQPSTGKYYRPLQGFYGMIGITTYAFDPICGSAILRSADDTARAMDKLARENKHVARVVEALLSVSTLGLVINAHTPILIAVLSHHAPDSLKEAIKAGLRAPFIPDEADGSVGIPEGNGGPL